MWQAIDKIRKENERLKEQLASESQNSAQNAEGQVLNLLGSLQETSERYTRKIDVEKRRLEDLEKQSKIMHVKTLELQQNREPPPFAPPAHLRFTVSLTVTKAVSNG